MSSRAALSVSLTVRVAWPTFSREVPEHVEDVFGHALRPGGLLVGKEEEEIDVGEGRERAAPIAADRDQRQPLGRGGVAHREDLCRGEIEERVDDAVGQRGKPLGGGAPVPVLLQPVADQPAPVGKHLLEKLQHRARGAGVSAPCSAAIAASSAFSPSLSTGLSAGRGRCTLWLSRRTRKLPA